VRLRRIIKAETPKLRKIVEKKLKQYGYDPVAGQHYIWAEGTLPAVLVAHMDTVHPVPPDQIFYDPKKMVMWSPQGLGADDRAGVWAILCLLLGGYRPHVLFTDLEEQGGIGAWEAAEEVVLPEGTRYGIGIDRRGKGQAVFYNEGNTAFKEYICSFGFKEHTGSFSDVAILSPAWGVACANLSAGYYNEHFTDEYLCLNSLEVTFWAVRRMLDEVESAPVFEHSPVYEYDSVYNDWISWEGEK